ncbi:MAG: hypothetical protein N4A41_11175 [Crocinitomicaceae bacterium]|jgi:hypothetical protein|nr:hypothetical protein [Crocinitomicaceae bacterium]
MQKYFCWAVWLFSSLAYGQLNASLTKPVWNVGTVAEVFDHRILRSIGANDQHGITNLGYQNLNDLQKEVDVYQQQGTFTVEVAKKTKGIYQDFYRGGMLHFFLTRTTLANVNARNFEIIIKDSVNQAILFKQRLEDDPGNIPSGLQDLYWNYFTLPIPKNLPKSFHVLLIDYSEKRPRTYSFVVQTSIQ